MRTRASAPLPASSPSRLALVDRLRSAGVALMTAPSAAYYKMLSTSRPPSSRTASDTSFWQNASSRMSPGNGTAFRPSARMSSTTSRASGSSTGR